MNEEQRQLSMSIMQVKDDIEINKKKLNEFVEILNSNTNGESEYIRNLKRNIENIENQINSLSQFLDIAMNAMEKLKEADEIQQEIQLIEGEISHLKMLMTSGETNSDIAIKITEKEQRLMSLNEMYNNLINLARNLVEEE